MKNKRRTKRIKIFGKWHILKLIKNRWTTVYIA